MKTFEQIGAEHGELVQRKNAAYGSSFAKCGEYMRLLYPDGVRPDQYEDVLLLARDFDKNMRIANHRDAFGENPYSDKIGYAILGYHLHQRTNEESTTCPGNANGAAKRSGNDPRDSAASHARSTTGPSTSATPEPAHLPQPDGCSIPLESSTAPAAPEPASASAGDPANWSRSERQHAIFQWCRRAFSDAQATSIPQRGLRLLEEAAEAAQASGVDVDEAVNLMVYVFGRKTGDLAQELGGVAVTCFALASAANLDLDCAEADEIVRVLSKPISEFKRRNAAKNAAGLIAKELL